MGGADVSDQCGAATDPDVAACDEAKRECFEKCNEDSMSLIPEFQCKWLPNPDAAATDKCRHQCVRRANCRPFWEECFANAGANKKCHRRPGAYDENTCEDGDCICE